MLIFAQFYMTDILGLVLLDWNMKIMALFYCF